MASDAEYMDFLDKANRDPAEGYTKTQQQPADFKATDKGVDIPAVLTKVAGDAVYITEADEPFEVVGLKFSGSSLPDEEEFAKLIEHPEPSKAEVEILDPFDWDSNGQYKNVIDAVREAGKGSDVRVYRVAKGRSRAVYWVVTKGENGALVGVKALGVES